MKYLPFPDSTRALTHPGFFDLHELLEALGDNYEALQARIEKTLSSRKTYDVTCLLSIEASRDTRKREQRIRKLMAYIPPKILKTANLKRIVICSGWTGINIFWDFFIGIVCFVQDETELRMYNYQRSDNVFVSENMKKLYDAYMFFFSVGNAYFSNPKTITELDFIHSLLHEESNKTLLKLLQKKFKESTKRHILIGGHLFAAYFTGIVFSYELKFPELDRKIQDALENIVTGK